MSSNRNLLVLFKNGFPDERAIEKEMEWLQEVLLVTARQFCTANELVDRNRITTNPKKILKETRRYRLRAFRFLINKN